MPIVTEWYNNEKTIIYLQFTGKWSWDELPSARQTVTQMLETVTHLVDFIADFQESPRIPSGALAIGRSIRNNRLPNERVTVIVGTSPMLRMLYHSFIFAFPASKVEYLLASNIEEALQILEEIQ